MGPPEEGGQAQHKNRSDVRGQLQLAPIPTNDFSVLPADCCPISLACTALPQGTGGAGLRDSPTASAPHNAHSSSSLLQAPDPGTAYLGPTFPIHTPLGNLLSRTSPRPQHVALTPSAP